MKIFLFGEVEETQSIEAKNKINTIINHNKPILYISLTKKRQNTHPKVKMILKDIPVLKIKIIHSKDELINLPLENYSAIFLEKENPSKLLKDLMNGNIARKINQFIENDGIIISENTSSIALGQCININENHQKRSYLMGLNLISNFSLICQFQQKKDLNNKYLLQFSKKGIIFALPKEDMLYYDEGKFEVFGNQPFYIIDDGNIITYDKNQNRKKKFLAIQTPNELMDFMNQNITYGWVDNEDKLHFNNLKHFREQYKTSTLDKILEFGIGTCIEQAKIIKSFLDRIGLENKLYCYRGYESENHFEKEVRMHCFILFKEKNKWYHFEHSNRQKRGIHQYDNIDSAIKNTISRFEKNDIRKLTEIPKIPDQLTFKEFNQYVNSFDSQ